MEIQEANKQLLHQLINFMDLISGTQYATNLPILSNNSIGKHIRHIVEFYQYLLNSYHQEQSVVDYDERPRNQQTETDKQYAAQQIRQLIGRLAATTDNKEMFLNFTLNESGGKQTLNTTFYRELAYNLEHTVHHLAIIKMAMMAHFPEIAVNKNFGVAYSTVQHQQNA
jgi:uncharacterized damage-inducible protein DinB